MSMARISVLALSLTVALICGNAAAQAKWYKGNTHTHSTVSDGDSSPITVARWYRDSGYDFLVLTDHNKLANVTNLQKEIDADPPAQREKKPFLLVVGEEVTSNFEQGSDRRPVHLNSIDANTTIGAQHGSSVVDIINKSADAITSAGGLAIINHPNFEWALKTSDLAESHGANLFEVYNGGARINNLGGDGKPGTEEMWDKLLTDGRFFYGTAADDAHAFKRFYRELPNPGRGWIWVRAEAQTPKAIKDAMARGQFYASTGVTLDDVQTTGGKLGLKINRWGNEVYNTDFITDGGRVVKTVGGLEPSCDLPAGSKYLRAKVTSSNRYYAWTQPMFAGSAKD